MYLTESTGATFDGFYNAEFPKETFYCPNIGIVYHIQTSHPFLPCFISNRTAMPCSDNYSSNSGFYPNCLKACKPLSII